MHSTTPSKFQRACTCTWQKSCAHVRWGFKLGFILKFVISFFLTNQPQHPSIDCWRRTLAALLTSSPTMEHQYRRGIYRPNAQRLYISLEPMVAQRSLMFRVKADLATKMSYAEVSYLNFLTVLSYN